MADELDGIRWIAVANQELARIYSSTKMGGALSEVASLEHPEARQQARDLKSDRPGRAFDSAGQGRHGMDPPTDPTEQEAIRFAREIAEKIEEGRLQDRFSRLVLVAGPHFLGLLRRELSEPCRKLVVAEVAKNLSQFDADQVRAHLPDDA